MHRSNVRVKGVPVSGGIATGQAQIIRDASYDIVRKNVPASRVEKEIARLRDASNRTITELHSTRARAVKVVGEAGANVFDAQVLIASDEEFLNSVSRLITKDRVNAEYAYQELLAVTMGRLDRAKDPYLRQMVNDIRAVSERVMSFLMGIGEDSDTGFAEPTILVGRIFSPGQVISYAKRNVVGFLTQEGGPTSHMALIVKSLGIPAVMADVDISEKVQAEVRIILDGNTGDIIVNPGEEAWKSYRRLAQKSQSQPFAVLSRVKQLADTCTDGHQVALAANLELPGPCDEHIKRLGVGIGLYRTEFLYFSRQSFPDEEEQFQIYSEIARRFHPLPVTLRTFDLGGDKYAVELGAFHEDNPALGARGVRVAIDAERVYKDQLRAILRASVSKNIKILIPMISDASDITITLKLIDKIKRELKTARIPFDPFIKIGAMIEVPSAALAADYLAEMVDFFSIGTNDLIQYTMAADRANHRVARYYQGHHPAVLRLIQMTIQAAHENSIPVTVCGELAGSKLMTPLLVGMGVNELSMNPIHLPQVGEWISHLSFVESRKFASRVMRLTTQEKIARALREAHDYIRAHKKGSWIK